MFTRLIFTFSHQNSANQVANKKVSLKQRDPLEKAFRFLLVTYLSEEFNKCLLYATIFLVTMIILLLLSTYVKRPHC